MAKQPDLAELLLDLSEKVARQSREPNILAYSPHEKQKAFHESESHIRLYIGGNRSGKTYGSVVEDIWWATGTHPFRETPPPPLRGRVVGVDFPRGIDQIILPLFKRLTTASQLRGGSWDKAYDNYKRILTFANGSTIEFMSYEMKTEKFAGTSRHFVHFDEEPPKHIYDECMARLIDTEGDAWISMTPVEGITWLYDKIYKPVKDAEDRELLLGSPVLGEVTTSLGLETTIIEVSTDENPHLTELGKKRFFSTLDEKDREARSRGSFLQKSGRVFPKFNRVTHVISKIENPKVYFKNCLIYTSVDHGWNNPTAWLWHAVRPDGTVITFGEHFRSHMTIGEHCQIVEQKEALWNIVPDHRTGDPAMKQTSGITGTSVAMEYAERGIYLELDSVPRDVATGLARMQQYFVVDISGSPHWFITEDCVNFIRELEGLHFKKFVSKKAEYDNNVHEEIQKKDDHTFDSARYFATFLPELAPDEGELSSILRPKAGAMEYDQALWLAHVNSQQVDGTTWKVLEEY